MRKDDNVFFGRATTDEEMSLDDYIKALQPVPDEDLFPHVPADAEITIAEEHERSVKRGRITGILLDMYQMTLKQFIASAGLEDLVIDSFLSALQSAVDHLHDLELAHNDINPGNIMMGDKNKPVLIDFGSWQPFGKLLQTFGTPGWFEEDFWTSEKKHDTFAMGKLREWLSDTKSDKSGVLVKSEL
ncbi:serine threonine protein kinase [Fusarium langsethiae]|uniref:Serine threonine protein kinase n=1 Tax=Fusarium langsethiae TaxID=179993 RepID=A0A0M9F4W4_FUSLA|nr:serine threonine protein kinase [Fusarium langsethiae]GKT98011.1 unnamed protein product [Fusarium langsethiae]GKU11108.1 unnamed protein product [Fusarium langsethiae]